MKKFSLLLLIILSSFGTKSLLSQSLDEWTSAAEQAFHQEDYYSAFRYYEVAIKYDISRMDLWYKLGESAQFFTAYNTANDAYRKVYTSSMRDSFPLLDFRRAEVLQKKGNYTDAANLFETFISKTDTLKAEAERNFINCEWAADELTRPAKTIVNHMGEEINSPQNDFGLFRKNDTTYFSSLRFLDKKDDVVPRRHLARILSQNEPDGKIVELPKLINQDGRMAAHTAYNTKGDVVYFTLCDYKGLTTEFQCEIYSSKINPNGQWARPERLPVNDANATNTEPNVGLSQDGKEYLYFASDRSGGQGRLDIYRSELLKDGSCGPVRALTDINTTGNDVTPFFYAPTQTLYFSTDGRLTMGGYDIYRSTSVADGWKRPAHMPVPVNSSYNDLYYARFEQEEHAYFASNRPDSLALFWDESKDACCNDIYKVGITDEIKLLVLTFDELDLTDLPLVSVDLYDITDGGRQLIKTIHNPTENDFNFIVIPGNKYELVATRSAYSTDTEIVDLTDPDLIPDERIEKRLYLAPGIKLDVFTFNEIDSTELAGTTTFLYELTSEGDLVLVGDSITNSNKNDFHYTLSFDKQYQIFTRKDGYTPAMAFIDTSDPDIAGESRIRRDLYLKPGLVLEVYSWRLLDLKPLVNASISLFEYTDSTGEKLITTITNPYGHQSWFEVKKGKRYVIRGERDGFGPAKSSLDLSGNDVPVTGTYRKDLYFGQLLEIFTFDANTEEKLPGAQVRLVDPSTGEVIEDRINPIDNDFRFSVALDRPYLLEINRKGYVSISDIITFTEENLKEGNGKITFDVYLIPLETPESMLPLFLYYDNDHPNPRSISPTTNLEYVETNVDYFQKKTEFIQSFTEGLELEEAYQLRQTFNNFFAREVRGGRYDLEEFAKRLVAHLEAGNTFTIDLKGFASPRSNAIYNEILSQRRIVTVKNYLERYDGGKLQNYIRIGALQFNELPLGETQTDPRVVAQMDDRKNSIYNVLASLERRVEVRTSDDKQ